MSTHNTFSWREEKKNKRWLTIKARYALTCTSLKVAITLKLTTCPHDFQSSVASVNASIYLFIYVFIYFNTLITRFSDLDWDGVYWAVQGFLTIK